MKLRSKIQEQDTEKHNNKFSKNLINFLLIILTLAIIFLQPFVCEIEASDELWNYQNVLKLYNKFLLYRDANTVPTPIFFYIGLIFFKIFGSSLLAFRIYNTFIYIFIFTLIYKILKKLNFSKHIALLSMILIFIIILPVINSGATYNALVMGFFLFGVYLYISRNENMLLHGLVMFLVFFTKQNIGFYYILAVIICDLYLNKFSKKFFINIIKKFLIFFALSGFTLLLFYTSSTLADFISFAFGGIFEFREKNISVELTAHVVMIALLPFIMYPFIVLQKDKLFKNIINKNILDNITILIVFCFFATFIAYPIINTSHLLFALPLHIIFSFYIFDFIMLEDFFDNEQSVTGTKIISIILLIVILLRFGVHYISIRKDNSFVKDPNSKFYGVMVENKQIQITKTMEKYITEQNNKNIDVIIVAFDSAFPMTELGQSHGVYDLVFNGNLGYNGVERIKNDILSRTNTEYLIFSNPDDLCYQDSTEVYNFIIDNLEFKGNIEHYSIYSTD